MRYGLMAVSVSVAALAVAAALAADEVRTGKAAFGDWRTDAPGVMRKITPAALGAPNETASTANRSRVIAKPVNAALQTMPGFSVAPLLAGQQGARVLRVAPNGDIFLARSRPEGVIVVIRMKPGADKPERVETYTSGLESPYGIAFGPNASDPQWMYVGEAGRVIRYPYRAGDMSPPGPPEVIISDIPIGGGHWTRDIAFSPDGKTLYVAVGSGSNVAENMGPKPDLVSFQQSRAVGSGWGSEDWRADVLAFDADGKNRRVFASGLRNCSGLAVQPGSGTLYCAVNERDLLGDNLPPDYVTSVKPGGFYGWPWFYIGNHADNRAAGSPRPDLADKVIVPDVLLQPHSAPLGLAFDDGNNFPPAWKGDAFVALHGSWNRATRTGYKIVRLPFKDGKPTGEYQDFVTGFVAGDDTVWGRPVDVAFAKDGSMLFTDDGNGVVYRVTYRGE